MIANLIVIFLILIVGYIFNKVYKLKSDTDKVRKNYVKLICLILILQSGLRNVAVGDDTYNYFQIFEEIKITSWDTIFSEAVDYYEYGGYRIRDPGYAVVQKSVQVFTREFQVFLIIIAILFFTAFGNFIYKNTTRLKDVIFAFLIYSVLFYSFFSVTGQKQTIATALVLFSYELLKKKKLLPFIMLVLVASTIHQSALVFIPFYFINQINKPRFFYTVILLLFPVIFIYNSEIANYLKVISGYEVYSLFEGAGTYTFTAIFLIISCIALIRGSIILKANPSAQHYYNAFAIALLFLPLTWFNPSAMRIVQYFSIFMVLFIPEIIHSFNYLSVKINVGIARFTIILLIALFLKSNWNSSSTYGFFWEDMRLPAHYNLRD